jgi:hypothetical protein
MIEVLGLAKAGITDQDIFDHKERLSRIKRFGYHKMTSRVIERRTGRLSIKNFMVGSADASQNSTSQNGGCAVT